MTNINEYLNLLIDLVPFLIYGAVLLKVWGSWRQVKTSPDEVRRNRMVAVLILLSVVVVCFLAGSAYTYIAYGKSYLSIRVFQLFVVGNCAVYWLLLDILTKDSVPEQGQSRESTG